MKNTLAEARKDFRLHQKSNQLAHNTIENRDVVVRQLLLHVGDMQLHSIKDKHISEFMLSSAKKRSDVSLSNTHSHLNSFFKWCVNTGRLKPQLNPMNGRRRPRFTERERQRVHVSKFPWLLDIASEKDARDRALIAVGLFALLRDQEMANLRIRDIDLDAGYMFAKITKSHTEDRVPISAALDSELRRWYVDYQKQVGALRPEYLLIPSVVKARVQKPTGGFATSAFVGYDPFKPVLKSSTIVTPLLEQAGIAIRDEVGKSTREGAHTLRRSGARALYDAFTEMGRVDALRIVQTLLHHKNIIETQRYIGLNPDRESRDTIMRGAVLYGFETVSVIVGGHHGQTESVEVDVRRMRA